MNYDSICWLIFLIHSQLMYTFSQSHRADATQAFCPTETATTTTSAPGATPVATESPVSVEVSVTDSPVVAGAPEPSGAKSGKAKAKKTKVFKKAEVSNLLID